MGTKKNVELAEVLAKIQRTAEKLKKEFPSK